MKYADKNYKRLNSLANVDRHSWINPEQLFQNEVAEESAEGLGGSKVKRGNNIINQEMYFKERSKSTINQSMIEDMLEELTL